MAYMDGSIGLVASREVVLHNRLVLASKCVLFLKFRAKPAFGGGFARYIEDIRSYQFGQAPRFQSAT